MHRSKIDFFPSLILVLSLICISVSSKQIRPRPRCANVVCKYDFEKFVEKMKQDGMKFGTKCSDCFDGGYRFSLNFGQYCL